MRSSRFVRAVIYIILTSSMLVQQIRVARAQLSPEVVKRGKQGTALVASEESEGSAFCISASGYFITNAHVVNDAKKSEKIHLIVNPGESDQQDLIATIVRLDNERDLALLKVERAKGLVALTLGDDKSLVETAQVTVFGYPFGKDLALEKQEFPSVSVNTGRITALRKAKGQLKQIQLDASLNPGNSGGPIVDTSGAVIGVVHEYVEGSNLNIAIPSAIVAEFLANSQIVMTPRHVTSADMSREQSFQIEVLPLLRPLDKPNVTLDLTVYKHAARRFIAKMTGPTTFTVKAVPAPPDEVTNYVQLSIRDKNKEYLYRVKDKRVSIGRYSLYLSELEFVNPIQGKAVIQGGKEILGAILGLNSVEADNHGQDTTLNFSRAAGMSISKLEPDIRSIDYEITVKQGADMILHATGEIPIGESDAASTDSTTEEIHTIQNPGNGHLYGLVKLDRLISWESARTAAQSMRSHGWRGHLATITSAAEQAFVFRNFPGTDGVCYWLGGYQDRNAPDYREPDKGWRWVTGEPWGYVNWGGIEPNNRDDLEDYLQLVTTDGHWNDTIPNDGHSVGFIVEFEP